MANRKGKAKGKAKGRNETFNLTEKRLRLIKERLPKLLQHFQPDGLLPENACYIEIALGHDGYVGAGRWLDRSELMGSFDEPGLFPVLKALDHENIENNSLPLEKLDELCKVAAITLTPEQREIITNTNFWPDIRKKNGLTREDMPQLVWVRIHPLPWSLKRHIEGAVNECQQLSGYNLFNAAWELSEILEDLHEALVKAIDRYCQKMQNIKKLNSTFIASIHDRRLDLPNSPAPRNVDPTESPEYADIYWGLPVSKKGWQKQAAVLEEYDYRKTQMYAVDFLGGSPPVLLKEAEDIEPPTGEAKKVKRKYHDLFKYFWGIPNAGYSYLEEITSFLDTVKRDYENLNGLLNASRLDTDTDPASKPREERAKRPPKSKGRPGNVALKYLINRLYEIYDHHSLARWGDNYSTEQDYRQRSTDFVESALLNPKEQHKGRFERYVRTDLPEFIKSRFNTR